LGNEGEVKKILEKAKDKEDVNIGNLMNNEMNKQEKNFKSRLEEKKKRKSIIATNSTIFEKINISVKKLFLKKNYY
jgi:hypothetical protein